ncbi:hypothetical protein SODALDRAFT_334384 [Sodiomyces alkalinus F11]|uniref:Uncharacterized protein n=1 Tax=Sodiomyces alkalinus (strain CBS 110278 / VKM F-3762 / F11) TaxID=1314773 RepID=A0A3N2PS06_SODAK|nr:hypothetical protein SODALDRAFT_334384 [Sodiomyces alkalinus F11]ROT37293.1 hypothetical protein SODALDRAFT_334384 [Sodiomyces alkalinus F11]
MSQHTSTGFDVSHVMNYITLTQTLVESFNTLANEVQSLTDMKTVLEHKLRFAHEQYQRLADKHAPAAPEIAETLAKLQLPPDLRHPKIENVTLVPLPRRTKLDTGNQVALTIRDGRRVANQLEALIDPRKTSLSSRNDTISRNSGTSTSMSTVLEQDFTIEGKKGKLECPFPAPANADNTTGPRAAEESSQDPTPHHSSDPICAAMYEESQESMSKPAEQDANGAGPAKCPIRFLDKHSPEEIAHYVETHKHELPRSHEVCLRRNQRTEDQIRKLDAKYGDIVGMIQDLSNLHKRMLPTSQVQREIDKASNERVENWAKAVTSSTAHGQEPPADAHVEADPADADADADADREGHFDRPFKEVRVGESPSRPWGISVPRYEPHGLEEEQGPPPSPPPAPVVMPTSSEGQHPSTPMKSAGGKCPFDHSKMAALMNGRGAPPPPMGPPKPAGDVMIDGPIRPETPVKEQEQEQAPPPIPPPQPTFINPPPPPLPPPPPAAAQEMKQGGVTTPQMIFTGPVFIGYPTEQAIQIMQHYQGRQ